MRQADDPRARAALESECVHYFNPCFAGQKHGRRPLDDALRSRQSMPYTAPLSLPTQMLSFGGRGINCHHN